MLNWDLERVVEKFNTWDNRIILFLLLSVNFLSFIPTGNEESCFATAKRFLEPDWIPASFSLQRWSGTVWLYNVLAGLGLKIMSFEQLAFWGRAFNFLLFAFPLGKIFRLLKLSNVEMCFLLQLFFFGQQTFFAESWIFGGFEPKTLAYFFIFYGLYFLLTDKPYHSVVATLVGTYFHVLIGGWFMLATGIYFLGRYRNIKKALGPALVYLAGILPLAIYLVPKVWDGGAGEINGTSINWIHVYFRNPHHLAPFKSLSNFAREYYPGILSALGWALVCGFVYSKIKGDMIRQLNLLILIIFGLIFAALIAGYFDSQGFFLKYYPFRMTTIAMFLVLLQTAVVAKEKLVSAKSILQKIMLLLVIPALLYPLTAPLMADPNVGKDLDELAKYARKLTRDSDIFMFLGYNVWETEPMTFLRKAERGRFVIFKYATIEDEATYEWYQRVLERNKVQQNINYLFELRNRYPISYIVSPRYINHSRLQLVFHNAKYKLYWIQPGT